MRQANRAGHVSAPRKTTISAMRCTKQMVHNEGKIIGALESDSEK